MSELEVSICKRCAARSFPTPLLCARCGHAVFRTGTVAMGIMEESVLVHRSGATADEDAPSRLGTVQVGETRVVVGLDSEIEPGMRVHLAERDGAPFAEPV